jgi:plastocyanin
MRQKFLFFLTGLLISAFFSCGSYDKDNFTAAAVKAEEEKNAMLHQHPGLHTVEILDMKFQPATISVKTGDTIVWVNRDMLAHDVTEEMNKRWMSGPIEAGSNWQKVISESDDYFCSIHSVMKGKIIVIDGQPVVDK